MLYLNIYDSFIVVHKDLDSAKRGADHSFDDLITCGFPIRAESLEDIEREFPNREIEWKE